MALRDSAVPGVIALEVDEVDTEKEKIASISKAVLIDWADERRLRAKRAMRAFWRVGSV